MTFSIGIYHAIGHISQAKPIFKNFYCQTRLPYTTPLFKKRKFKLTSKWHQISDNTANGNNNISQNQVYENIEESTDETDIDPSNFRVTATVPSVRVPLGALISKLLNFNFLIIGVTSIDGDDDFDFVESNDIGIKAAAKSRSVFEVLLLFYFI